MAVETPGREADTLAASRRAALIAATLASFLTPFVDSSIVVALPTLSREFGVDAVTLTWIRTAYLLAAAMFLVPFGKLADIHGRKKVFVIGTGIFTVAAVLEGLSVSPAMLIATRMVDGLGGAMIFSTGVAILTSAFPPAQRGRVLGINAAAVYLGLSLGPTIGGVLTQQLSWRAIFFFIAVLGLVVFIFARWRLKGEWAEARGDRFDLAGSAVYGVSLVAVMYGISTVEGPLGIGLLVAGAAGLAGFALWELRTASPVLNMKLLFSNRPFAFSSLAALINYGATSAVGLLLSLYLQYLKGLDPEIAGLVLIAQPVIMAAFSPIAGRLSDRVEPHVVASAGMAMLVVGLVLLVLLSPATPLWAIILRLLLMGLGFALFSAPNQNAIMSSVERRFYGVASGMLGTMRLVGQTLSMGITTLLFALYIGPFQIAPPLYPQFLSSVRTTFVVFAALCLAGVFASLARGAIRGSHGPEESLARVAPGSDR